MKNFANASTLAAAAFGAFLTFGSQQAAAETRVVEFNCQNGPQLTVAFTRHSGDNISVRYVYDGPRSAMRSMRRTHHNHFRDGRNWLAIQQQQGVVEYGEGQDLFDRCTAFNTSFNKPRQPKRPVSRDNFGPHYGSNAAGSWGGKVRSGPGMHYRQVGSTFEGQQLTIIRNTQQYMNGYPWFEVRLTNGRLGYQWGGLMCGYGAPREGMHRICR